MSPQRLMTRVRTDSQRPHTWLWGDAGVLSPVCGCCCWRRPVPRWCRSARALSDHPTREKRPTHTLYLLRERWGRIWTKTRRNMTTA